MPGHSGRHHFHNSYFVDEENLVADYTGFILVEAQKVINRRIVPILDDSLVRGLRQCITLITNRRENGFRI